MSRTIEIRMPKVVTWTPKDDITAIEIAQALPILMVSAGGAAGCRIEDAIEALPATVRRHFTVKDHPVFK